MIVRKYVDWQKILLDTSVILALLRSQRDETSDVCNFIKKLISDLSKTKSSSRKERVFCVSAITISEVLEWVDNEKVSNKIVRAIDSDYVEIHSYDRDIAEFIVKNYHPFLNKDYRSQLARTLSWPEHEIRHGRDWIEKDLMLIGTANFLQCDTILTIDKSTMLPMADKVGYFCALAYPEHYQLSSNGKSIFNYNRPYSKPKKSPKPPKSKKV